MINIEGLNRADVLKELYNNSKPLGMGILHYNPKPMTTEEAQELLNNQTYFDYLYRRVMKVDLSSDIQFTGRLYDRDNGEGAAERVINKLRNK